MSNLTQEFIEQQGWVKSNKFRDEYIHKNFRKNEQGFCLELKTEIRGYSSITMHSKLAGEKTLFEGKLMENNHLLLIMELLDHDFKTQPNDPPQKQL